MHRSTTNCGHAGDGFGRSRYRRLADGASVTRSATGTLSRSPLCVYPDIGDALSRYKRGTYSRHPRRLRRSAWVSQSVLRPVVTSGVELELALGTHLTVHRFRARCMRRVTTFPTRAPVGRVGEIPQRALHTPARKPAATTRPFDAGTAPNGMNSAHFSCGPDNSKAGHTLGQLLLRACPSTRLTVTRRRTTGARLPVGSRGIPPHGSRKN
jgi:hypothetical protein